MRYLSVVLLFVALVAGGMGYTTHDVTGYLFAVLFAGAGAFLLLRKTGR